MRRERRAGRAFTLVEMIVVLAIISILASFLTAGLMVARRRGGIASTKAFISRLDLAVKQFEIDFGDYPGGAGGIESAELLRDTLTSRKWTGSQEFSGKEVVDTDGNGRLELVDYWRQSIAYYHNRSYSGQPRATTFRLVSKGPDGVEGTNDDITNF